jgi:hypothetical protein
MGIAFTRLYAAYLRGMDAAVPGNLLLREPEPYASSLEIGPELPLHKIQLVLIDVSKGRGSTTRTQPPILGKATGARPPIIAVS